MTAGTETSASPSGDAVTVGYVHSNEVTYSWHHSMVEMVGYDLARHGRIIRGGYIAMRCGTGGLVEARNKTVTEFLASKDADWLLWLDTDMGFPADLCERLLEVADPAQRPIVGALCFSQRELESDGMGGWRCQAVPTVLDWAHLENGQEGFAVRWDYPHDTVTRCAGTGSAAILVHRSVFSRVAAKYGPAWYEQVPNPTTGQLMGEDLSFCARAGALGIPVFVHTGVVASHMKRVWLGENDYHAQRLADPAALLRGDASSILFGKPVKLSVSWPEGPPDGMSEEELAQTAAAMDAERGRLNGAATRDPVSSPAGGPV